MFKTRHPGFTLAELLIALTILGVIAAFTIPKLLYAQRQEAWKAEGKEAIAAVSSAYLLYKSTNQVNANTGTTDFSPYLNYTKLDTTALVDHLTGQGSIDCSTQPCYQLHNGGMLIFGGSTFGATNSTNYIHFFFDPDGQYSGTTNGPGKSMSINLYFNGKIATGSARQAGDITYLHGNPESWGPDNDPDWFSW